MKILKIGGKNLASLAEEFSVDFEQEPLASSGLFAISGPTGAGKSTLLDALCLALYDATPRLLKALGRSLLPDVGGDTISTQDPRTLLRRGAAEGYAEVDFVGGDGASYRARWSVRRSRTKAAGALQATVMSLHRLPALQPIGATKTEVKAEIEKRVGLSFEQFTRAVLLAQNEFSAFLKAEDNERGELLEKLTGSTIYSEISIRAFERAKLEQAALQRLNERLADQKPLGMEQRAALQEQSTAANQVLAELELRKSTLERDLRWHQHAAKLRQDEQTAQQTWQERAAEMEAAAERRAALARIEAVQPARPLADDIARIDSDIVSTQNVVSHAATQAEQAGLAQQQAATTLTQAAAQLEQAETALRAAAPQLDQAKALDARIKAMLPAHGQAAAASETVRDAEAQARIAHQSKQEQRKQLVAEQDASTAWLAQHQQWQSLAQSWERWDVLFVQAGQAAAQGDKLMRLAAQAQHGTDLQRARAADLAAKQAHAAQRLETLEAQRQAAIAALEAFPAESLQDRRGALEQRRDLLTSAEKIWIDLAGKQARSQQMEAQAAQLRAARQDAETSLAQVRQEHTGIMAAFVQAERSLKVAEAACAENVEKLRATLEDDTPCPVCGAHDHPYRHDDGALQAMLSGLGAELERCRQQLQRNIAQEATHRANAQSSVEQLALLAAETRTLHEALARATSAWREHALLEDSESVPQADAREAWFRQQLAVTQAGLQEIERQERAMRAALAAKDKAQQACDQAAEEQRRLLAAASEAQTALAQIEAELKALDQQRNDVALQLCELLSDLDPAFSGDDLPSEAWRDDWKSGPARFHDARKTESRRWLTQHEAHTQRAAAIATFDIELNALAQALDQATRNAMQAQAAFDAAELAIRATRDQRALLWNGREVSAVEAQLHAAIDTARQRQLAQQQASDLAAQARIRLDEALAQARQRLEGLHVQAATAAQRLSAWLTDFQSSQPEAGVENLEQLRALLAHPPAAALAERQALQAMADALADAATVLKERQNQSAQHQQTAPDGEQSADMLTTALATLEAERKTAHDAATALHLALAQDDARRVQSQSMLATIEQQEQNERRWAGMNELIGSADGKKFRNYAQQFTLDVLLGYANAHLNQLARRYRLERIVHPAAPSLGLLVCDLDMGGELRSVHSLSGGESFLVSLALALGLASLSSNRVRVESLFIDEGFGSLDADTLRVAMDALDGLQAMGRKVGVISHVQEMTERISTRILVQPSAGGKSAVRVR